MKKITLSIVVLAALSSGAWAQGVNRSIKPKPGPAPEITLGKSESFVLPNGMKVFVVENHKLPTIECSIELDIKPELEGEMAGYRDMMSELLVSGTKTRSKDKLNTEIDQMGASISASSTELSGSGLKKYQNKIFELMADIAMNSEIKAEELEKVRKQVISDLETQKNQPDAMVRNVSARLNFGQNHPYGEVANEQTVSKITVERCNQYYQTYFRPNVAYMAIVGDVTLKEVKPLIEKYFGAWKKQDVPVTNYTIPAVNTTKLTKVAFAPRTAAVQSVVDVTYPVDLKPGSDDAIKAKVANNILGGGSQGRLFLNIREKHGWGYGAYSDLHEDNLGASMNITLKAKNIVSDSALEALMNEMRIIRNEKVDNNTLQNCIAYMSGNFAIGLEDPSRIAQFAINIERYHMPKDYYKNYLKNLGAVTADDVQMAAKKYIRPENANIVVAGSREEVAAKLAKFSADGKIDYYDFSGRSIKVSETKPVPAGVTADMVMKNYIAAMGGEKAYTAVKDIKIVSSSTIQGMPLTITEMKKAPTKWKETIDVAMGGNKMTVQKQVYNGTTGFQEQQGQKEELKGDDLDEVVEQADFTADLHPEKYGIKRTLTGVEPVAGNDAYVIEVVNAKGKKSVEYYDVKNNMQVKKVQGEGEKMQSFEYSDYREVPGTNGFKVPYKVQLSMGPQNLTATVESVEVNKGIADTEFNN